MTAREAARHCAAALVERALASAHREWSERGGVIVVPDTFEHAPPNVIAAMGRGLDGDAVGEEMARLAEELRRGTVDHEDWCDLVKYNECTCKERGR